MFEFINLNVLNGIAFFWLLFWVLLAFKSLAEGKGYSILFVIPIHFLFAGIPLMLDVLFGKPEYSFPGFLSATQDTTTSIIYCFYVSAVPVFWWWTARGEIRLDIDSEISNKTFDKNIDILDLLPPLQLILYFILIIILISPIFAWLSSPDPEIYHSYGVAGATSYTSEDQSRYHNLFITPTCMISVLGAAGLLSIQKRISLPIILFLIPWLGLTFWLNGKRYIVGFAALIIGYIFWQKGYLKGSRFAMASLLALASILIFSSIYQAQVRKIDTQFADPAELYEAYRVDFGRDAEIKMAIFAELYPDQMQILEYRGQSALYYLTIFVPRDSWSQKPMPYAQYVTSAALIRPPKEWGWSVTTSILDEAITNFSWAGMIIGPLLVSVVCRLGDSRKNSLVSPMTVLVASLFQAVHLVAFWSLFLFWLILIITIPRPNNHVAIEEY
jgi:oligosaccharide repeat unit polymerase